MPSKILLADDSVTIQKVVELTFSEGDYQVTCVSNGKQAVEQLDKNRPDIIICDIIMPEMSGYDVAEFVKKNPVYTAIPVILLTGTFEPFDEERARKSGAEAYVTKPFDSKMLVEKVESLLSQKVRMSSSQSVAPATMFSGREEYQLPGVMTDDAVRQMDAQAKEKSSESAFRFPEVSDMSAEIPGVDSLPPELPAMDLPQIVEMPMPGEKGEPAELKGFDALMEPPVPEESGASVLEATASSVDNDAAKAVREEISAATEAMGMETPEEPYGAVAEKKAFEEPKIDSYASDFAVPEILESAFEEPKPIIEEPAANHEAAELKAPVSEVSIEDIPKTEEAEVENLTADDIQDDHLSYAPALQSPTFAPAGEVEIGAFEEEAPGFMAGMQAEAVPFAEPPAAIDSSILVTDLNEQAMMVAEGQKKIDDEMADVVPKELEKEEEFEEAQEYPIHEAQPEEEPVERELPASLIPQDVSAEPEMAVAETGFPDAEEAAGVPLFKEPAEAPEALAVPEEPARAEAKPEIQVSREMVEEIVKKVIDDIAPGIVRNIAWEVIPELANSMIKKRIEELEKDAE
jgi:CheY-like chemotaxis protein